MSRHTINRGEHLEFSFWLIFDAKGDVRLSRGEASLGSTERAMHCVANVPKVLFKTPSLRAEITVPAGGDPSGVITAEIRVAAEEALKQVVGLDVVLTVQAGLDQ